MVNIVPVGATTNVPNGAVPCEGTKAYPLVLDFTGGKNAYIADFTAQYQARQFTTLQTIYIDNSLNLSPLVINCNGTQQIITAPPLSQGFYALLLSSPPKFNASSNGNVIVNVVVLNFYIPPAVWTIDAVSSGGLPQIDIPALDAIIVGGALVTTSTPYTIQGMTDASGTITVGGTPQPCIPANSAARRWIIANPATATEILSITVGATVFDLFPGSIWDENGSTIIGDAILVNAATTGHAFKACYK